MVAITGGRKLALNLVKAQSILTIVLAFLWALLSGVGDAYSAIEGGLVCILPNILFARFAFAKSGARAAKSIVKDFYFGEFLKLLATAVLFAIFIILGNAKMLPMLSTYFLVQTIFWFALRPKEYLNRCGA